MVRKNALPWQVDLQYNEGMLQAISTQIDIRPNRDGHDRAYIAGTRVRVQDVAVMAEIHGLTPDQIAESLPHLSLAQIHASLSYYFDHRAAIQRELHDDAEFVEQCKALFGPGPLEQRLKPATPKSVTAPPSDSVSS